MIYLDACALLKFIKLERETQAIRAWRTALPENTELITSELARLELTRTMRRGGVEPERVQFYVSQAIRGVYLVDLTTTVLDRAAAYHTARLGSQDAIHLASADPFRSDVTEFVTYDQELAQAATGMGFAVAAPG